MVTERPDLFLRANSMCVDGIAYEILLPALRRVEWTKPPKYSATNGPLLSAEAGLAHPHEVRPSQLGIMNGHLSSSYRGRWQRALRASLKVTSYTS